MRVVWGLANDDVQQPSTPPPIVVSAGRHIHLTFDPYRQRLQSIVVQSILASAASQSHDSYDEEFNPSLADPNVSQTWYRHVVINYHGRPLFATSPAHTDVPALTRSMVHQTLGPTYPARDHPDAQGTTTPAQVLSYPGLAFAFPLDPTDQATLTPASTVYIFDRASRHPFLISGKDRPLNVLRVPALSPAVDPSTSSSALTTEESWVDDAVVFPGQGLRIVLSAHASPSSRHRRSTDSADGLESETIDLVLGETQVQDILADLGTPEARAWKEDQRLEIHERSRPQAGQRTSPVVHPNSESDPYDDLGQGQHSASESSGTLRDLLAVTPLWKWELICVLTCGSGSRPSILLQLLLARGGLTVCTIAAGWNCPYQDHLPLQHSWPRIVWAVQASTLASRHIERYLVRSRTIRSSTRTKFWSKRCTYTVFRLANPNGAAYAF